MEELTQEERFKKLLDKEPAWVIPGTERYAELQRKAEEQSFLENVKEGFRQTGLSAGIELLRDELPGILENVEESAGAVSYAASAAAESAKILALGKRAGKKEDYIEEHYDKLTKGIPSQYHDEIFQGENLASAMRARNRILSQLDRGRRLGRQYGFSDNLGVFMGAMVDVDLPLIMLTGGGFKAAQVAGKAMMGAKAAGLGPGTATRLASAATGASGGLQAGVIAGAAEAHLRETSSWTVIAETALAGMVLGTTFNTVLGGDRLLAVRKAREQLHKIVKDNDPRMNSDPYVDADNADPIQGDAQRPREAPSATPEDSGTPGDLGAARNRDRPILEDPAGEMPDSTIDYINRARNWREDSGWQAKKVLDDQEFWSKVAMSDVFSVSTRDFRTLYSSKSAVLNWMAGNVFESPHGLGRGRYTAAAGMEFYHRRIVNNIYRDVPLYARQWAKKNKRTWQGSGYGISGDGKADFNREVMLEMNDRAMERVSDRDPFVKKAADAYEKAGQESLRVARGGRNQRALDGFDEIPDRRGYTPYVWSGRNVLDLEKSGKVSRKAIIDAMARAYNTAGIPDYKDASLVARAVLDRAISRDSEINTNLVNLLSGDGLDFLRKSLERSGVPDDEIKRVMDRLTYNLENRSKESFAKFRNEIDLTQRIETKDGSDVRIVDLLDKELDVVWQNYSRRIAGASALARVGITNRAQREAIIRAAQAEQRALGEDVIEGDILRALFSHFNGGPVHGYANGKLNEGIGLDIAVLKRATNLALLGKLGFAQMAETGASIATAGLEAWWRRGPAALFDRELKKGNQDLLDDMAYILGDLGYDHKAFMQHMDLDDVSVFDKKAWLQTIGKLTSKGQYIQNYTSLFNTVRGFQQRTVSMAITDKIFRTLKESLDSGKAVPEDIKKRFNDDLGLNADDLLNLQRLIQDGTIEFSERNGKTFVNRINIDSWDTDFAEVFASAITRNMNQTVQKSMAGEQDAWLNTPMASMLLHLKTFPLQAIQKQFIRNVRHSDQQALATVYMGLATSYVALSIRDAIDGKDRTDSERAKIAFGYANVTGWVPMFYDPAMTMLGYEDYRINAWGPHSDLTPASIETLNRGLRVPGSVVDTLTGDNNWHDRQSLRALPFSNTLGLARILDD